MESLPKDVQLNVLRFLVHEEDLAKAQRVCRTWRSLILDHNLVASVEPLCFGNVTDFSRWPRRINPANVLEAPGVEQLSFMTTPGQRSRQKGTWGTGDLRMCLIGQGGSGKSASIIRLCHDHFVHEYDPTVEDTYRKQISMGGKLHLLDVLDTAGCEDFSPMRHQMMMGSEVVICVFAVDDAESLVTARNYLEHQRIRTGINGGGDSFDVEERKVLLCANKVDLECERVVSRSQGLALARELRVAYIETSAKTGQGIVEAFETCWRLAACRRLLEGGNKARARKKNAGCGIH